MGSDTISTIVPASEDLQDYQTNIYAYSGQEIIYEKNVITGQEATYVYGPAGLVAKNASGLTDYYHTDLLGSTRLITDESGNPVTEVDYTPFGENTQTGEKDPYLYIGKEEDSTGLYYFGARYYDCETGRFITRDPLPGNCFSPQTLNQYVYCLNNPLTYIDPKGMAADKMNLQYVILPDGTISYDLAELYNQLQEARKSMTEEDWKQIEILLNDSTDRSKKKAVMRILKKAGIEFEYNEEQDSLSVTFGDREYYIGFDNFTDKRIWGAVQSGESSLR